MNSIITTAIALFLISVPSQADSVFKCELKEDRVETGFGNKRLRTVSQVVLNGEIVFSSLSAFSAVEHYSNLVRDKLCQAGSGAPDPEYFAKKCTYEHPDHGSYHFRLVRKHVDIDENFRPRARVHLTAVWRRMENSILLGLVNISSLGCCSS